MKYIHEIKNNTLVDKRKVLGLRQRDVTIALSFGSTDRISHWEHGTAMPSLPNLFRLCALYQCLPHEVYPALLEKTNSDIEHTLRQRFFKKN
ncbi:MAG: hypothetical protein RJA07_934 [Bacteroidota bacterium]|jgi:hypothetical protein